MVMKHYPPEFKAEAVALYRSRPEATIAQIADDLGINRETLRLIAPLPGTPNQSRCSVPPAPH